MREKNAGNAAMLDGSKGGGGNGRGNCSRVEKRAGKFHLVTVANSASQRRQTGQGGGGAGAPISGFSRARHERRREHLRR